MMSVLRLIEDHPRLRAIIELWIYIVMIIVFAQATGEIPAALGAMYVVTTYTLRAVRRSREES